MSFTEFRLKVRHFFRKNGKLMFIIFLVWSVIFLVNLILKYQPKNLAPTTTYEAHASVLNPTSKVPEVVSSKVEDMIKEYIDCCNEGKYQKAFSMISEDCRKHEFNDDIEVFMTYVITKMPTPRKYTIQNYSNMTLDKKKLYIYEVKFFDDYLATGLTDEMYGFTSDRISFYQGDDGLEMNVGNYIYHTNPKRISENEYLKIDVTDRRVNYSIETYTVKFTNKSNYTIVISDNAEADEVVLRLPNEYRNRSETYPIVLAPGETDEIEMVFKKFVDDGDDSLALAFNLIRVMEQYSGVDDVSDEVIQSEIDNAISKFSMSVDL